EDTYDGPLTSNVLPRDGTQTVPSVVPGASESKSAEDSDNGGGVMGDTPVTSSGPSSGSYSGSSSGSSSNSSRS
nr:hypothetical protein [Tanacetum cinerariifolium]